MTYFANVINCKEYKYFNPALIFTWTVAIGTFTLGHRVQGTEEQHVQTLNGVQITQIKKPALNQKTQLFL